MSLRDIKRAARLDLHRGMQVKAFYYPPDEDWPQIVQCRTHYQFGALGDVKGTSFGYAETREQRPYLIFMLEPTPEQPIVVDPDRNALVMVSPTEGYRIDDVDPRDFITRKAYCVPLPDRQLGDRLAPPAVLARGDVDLPAFTAG